jgi:hypothetical protein
MERLEKVSVDMELKRVKDERCMKELVKNGGVVKGELGFGRCIVEGMKKRKVVDMEDEKVEEKRRVGEQRMKDCGGGSGMKILNNYAYELLNVTFNFRLKAMFGGKN